MWILSLIHLIVAAALALTSPQSSSLAVSPVTQHILFLPVLAADAEPTPTATPVPKARFTLPLNPPYLITDRFGLWRPEGLHTGIDLAVYSRAVIRASCSGTVQAVGWDGGFGIRTLIDCGEGWHTLYAHHSETFTQPGEWVEQGQPIGLTGLTGHTTGEHLHFEIHKNGVPVNPATYLLF